MKKLLLYLAVLIGCFCLNSNAYAQTLTLNYPVRTFDVDISADKYYYTVGESVTWHITIYPSYDHYSRYTVDFNDGYTDHGYTIYDTSTSVNTNYSQGDVGEDGKIIQACVTVSSPYEDGYATNCDKINVS
ncbi:MAG TPA: hypothetical protein VFK44_03380 [Bacillales bacterium]|nr:hypothetical protein [Bacillales bacterium]